MSNHKRILKKKKNREHKVKLKLARRKASIQHDAKMEKEAKEMDWAHREEIEPIKNPPDHKRRKRLNKEKRKKEKM